MVAASFVQSRGIEQSLGAYEPGANQQTQGKNMQSGFAYLINGTTSTMTALLNQASSGSLGAISLSHTAPWQIHANQWIVPYKTGSNVPGVLASGGSTLQLMGGLYSSTGSPVFRIEVDSMTIPPANSWLFVWIFRQTLAIADQNGNTAGIKVIPMNIPAKRMVDSPNDGGAE